MANGRTANPEKPRRITIDLKAPAVAELDRLRERTGVTTAELFRHAFNLLRMYVSVKESGGDLQLVEPGREDRVVMLPFSVEAQERVRDGASGH